MTLCLGSALPVNLARGGRMRPTERRFYKTGMNRIALLFKQLIKIKKQSGEMVSVNLLLKNVMLVRPMRLCAWPDTLTSITILITR